MIDESVMSLDWMPDGKSFLYSDFPFFGKKPEDTGIHIIDSRTRHVATIPKSKGMVNPIASPDGHYIAASTASGTKQTMLFDTRTGAWSPLVDSRGIPRWSRDSQWLFYLRVGEAPAIMKIRISDRQIEHVADLESLRQAGALAGVQFGYLQTTCQSCFETREHRKSMPSPSVPNNKWRHSFGSIRLGSGKTFFIRNASGSVQNHQVFTGTLI